jgi:predicted RNA binding protein YcfA (HicA-like mRNA interferase family)
MPRGINNWSYDDVSKFLKNNGFIIKDQRGSHCYFTGYKNDHVRMVTVPFHGRKSINPRTMKSIIIQSGIDKSVWLEK